MSVLLLPPIFQFFDDNGVPLANGFVETYAAGTTTPLATYTDFTGTTEAPNPIELDAAGRPTSGSGAIWGEGAYKFIVKDANGVQVGDVLDNVTSFTALASATNTYFQSFSGNGTQTVFTTSDDLGTEEKALMVFVSKGLDEIAVNGTFATDTDWTKGAGWTIAAGVATATGGISTSISQVPVISLVVGQAYAVTYTITRSAGGLIPSLGTQAGVERTASGTYREIIIAAATTPISFTGNGFTGTLDSVSITRADAQGYDILSPSAYTINGTSLTFASAPATGTNNIYVFAPSLLLGAASSAAALAQLYAANALTSQTSATASAASAAGFSSAKNSWTFSSNTAMADPGTGFIRFNDANPAFATAIAIDDLSANVGNPDLSTWILSWDDNTGSTVRGTLYLFKDQSNFVFYNITGASTDNVGWTQLVVTLLTEAGTISNNDALFIGFAAAGTTIVTGGFTALTGDVTASGSGSVAATIANSAVTDAKLAATLDLSGKTVSVATATAGDSDTTAASTAFVQQEITRKTQISRTTAQFDKTDTTLANITGLSANVDAGGVYDFEADFLTTSVGGNGIKMAVGGTCTATRIDAYGWGANGTGFAPLAQAPNVALGAAIAAQTAVTIIAKMKGSIVVNTAGTLTAMFAQNTASGTSSVLIGSTFKVTKIS